MIWKKIPNYPKWVAHDRKTHVLSIAFTPDGWRVWVLVHGRFVQLANPVDKCQTEVKAVKQIAEAALVEFNRREPHV